MEGGDRNILLQIHLMTWRAAVLLEVEDSHVAILEAGGDHVGVTGVDVETHHSV